MEDEEPPSIQHGLRTGKTGHIPRLMGGYLSIPTVDLQLHLQAKQTLPDAKNAAAMAALAPKYEQHISELQADLSTANGRCGTLQGLFAAPKALMNVHTAKLSECLEPNNMVSSHHCTGLDGGQPAVFSAQAMTIQLWQVLSLRCSLRSHNPRPACCGVQNALQAHAQASC